MGIHGLAKLIADQAPTAIKEQEIKSYFGKSHCDSPTCQHASCSKFLQWRFIRQCYSWYNISHVSTCS